MSTDREPCNYKSLSEELLLTHHERALKNLHSRYDEVQELYKKITIDAKKAFALNKELGVRAANDLEECAKKRRRIQYGGENKEKKEPKIPEVPLPPFVIATLAKIPDVDQPPEAVVAVAIKVTGEELVKIKEAKSSERRKEKETLKTIRAEQEGAKEIALAKPPTALEYQALLAQLARLEDGYTSSRRSGRRDEEESC